MSLKRRSLFAALLGATAVKGAECISGEAHGDFNSYEWEQCVDGKWVKRVGSDDSRNMRTPPTFEDRRAVQLPGIRNELPINSESLGCPFNHDWEKVPNAFLSYIDPNADTAAADYTVTDANTVTIYIGSRPKPNPPIPGVSRCKICGVLGMPK